MKRSIALFYTESDLALARDNLEREPIISALPLLDAEPSDPLARACLAATKYRLRGDVGAAEQAMILLREADIAGLMGGTVPAAQGLLGWLSVSAMLRDRPGWRGLPEARIRTILARLDETSDENDLLLLCWLSALNMAASLLYDSMDSRDAAAAAYRLVVDQHIHPEGYFKGMVDIEAASDTYASQVSAAGALALTAEMAQQHGLELWAHNNRGVSLNTAATYAFYYYFFPERWRWGAELTREQTIAIMRGQGAFYEMVNRRYPLRGVEQLFAEQRPMFCPHIGLTTLTHSLTPARKKRWRIF